MRARRERQKAHPRPIGAMVVAGRGVAGRGVAGRGVVFGVLLFTMLGLVSCGSENPGTAAGPTTTNPGSNSTVIDPYAGGAAADPAATACLLLADTVGLDGLVPIDSSSWRDERERLLVDAQRESSLLKLAARGVPPELSPALETLATNADRVAEEISQATSYTDAMIRLESTGVVIELRAASDALRAWRDTNC